MDYVDAQGKEILLLDQILAEQPLLNSIMAVLLVAVSAWLPKRGRIVLLAGYMLFIGYMTLFVRESGDQRLNLTLFWSYRQLLSDEKLRLEIFHNILLFIPFGALVYSLWPRWTSILLALLLSGLIEATQLVWGLGLCELDDVFSNTMGAAIGAGAYKLLGRMTRWKRRAGSGGSMNR
ncbi:MAG: VanZ family protein [Aristaeellaceae bacterium]